MGIKGRERGWAWIDRAGISISVLCSLHCAALTIVLLLLPSLWLRRQVAGIDLRWLVLVEWLLAAGGIGFAALAGVVGCVRHGRLRPPLLLAIGALLLGASVFTDLHRTAGWGTLTIVAGAAFLVLGHRANLRAADSRSGRPSALSH
jgi:hypothetical protein